jgi:hypothetical protein
LSYDATKSTVSMVAVLEARRVFEKKDILSPLNSLIVGVGDLFDKIDDGSAKLCV